MKVNNSESFQVNGVYAQIGAKNMRQALNSYNESCLRCTMSYQCSGTQCAITRAFLMNREKFDKQIQTNPILRKEVEKALEMG